MSRRRRRIVKSFIAALGVAVALGPNAAAQRPQDLRSPDARDAAAAAAATAPSQDLRSPDARDAASAAPEGPRQLAKWMAYDRAVSSLTPAHRTVASAPVVPQQQPQTMKPVVIKHSPQPAHDDGSPSPLVYILPSLVLVGMLVAFGGMFILTRHPGSRTRVVSS
jgi:hypothetical protein